MGQGLETLEMDSPVEVRSDLFDYSVGYDDDTGIVLAPGLTKKEKKEAVLLYRIFTMVNEPVGLTGLCIVSGKPRSGKDTFGNILVYKLKKYFKQKKVLRDEKPRPLFGEYDGLFNPQVIQADLAKMREIAQGEKDKVGYINAIEGAAEQWVTEKGEVLLKHSILYLTEFWRYCYNREPHAPMNKTMGGIHKMKAHLDTLIIGNVQQLSDLDTKTCLPFVDWRVSCVKSRNNKTGFIFWVDRVIYDIKKKTLVPIGEGIPIPWDAGEPRTDLGNGKIEIKKLDYIPETEEESIVLNVIREGYNTVESIDNFLYEHGDMDSNEILDTIKELRFGISRTGARKGVLKFPCYFDLFNSKSAPQINSSLKI